MAKKDRRTWHIADGVTANGTHTGLLNHHK